MSNRQETIIHAHNNLVTILNQTLIHQQQLATRQQQLFDQSNKMTHAFNNLQGLVESNAYRIARLELLTAVDRHLDSLQMAVNTYLSQVTLFHRQRAELEMSHLTRDLLPEQTLLAILKQAASHYKVIDAVEWFYQYLSVTPIWQDSNSLLYKVEIPLLSDRPYLLFNIITHPVPVANALFAVTVNLVQLYGINTLTGNLILPES